MPSRTDRARLPSRQQTDRNLRIVADRARGLGWQTIADRHELSIRQCQNIWVNRGEDQYLVESPRQELEGEIEAVDASIDELAQLAETTTHDAVRLGAIKAKLNAQAFRIELKRAAGILPHNLGAIANENQTRQMTAEMVKVLERYHESGEEVWSELHAVITKYDLDKRRELAWETAPLEISGASDLSDRA